MIVFTALALTGCQIGVGGESVTSGGPKSIPSAMSSATPVETAPNPPTTGSTPSPKPISHPTQTPGPAGTQTLITASPPAIRISEPAASRLRIASVKFKRYAPGATICWLLVTVVNDGAGRAEAVVVKASAKTLSYPIYTMGLGLLEGPGSVGARQSQEYARLWSIAVENTTPLGYHVELHQPGKPVVSMDHGAAVYCD